MMPDRPTHPNRLPPADGDVLFHERQPLHQNMIIRVVMPVMAIVVGVVLLTVGLGPGAGNPATLVLIFLAVGVAFPLLLFMIRLETIVTGERLIVRYRPFPGRDVDAGEIIEATAVRYHPIRDAGGWGWRISPRYHRVFNVSGNRGVHVRRGPGRRDQFLLGSRRPDELVEAIGLARFNRLGKDDPSIVAAGRSSSPPM